MSFNYCNIISQSKYSDNAISKDDTTGLPFFSTDKDLITVPKPEGKFITNEIKFYNIGKGTLIIDKVNASCFCASATILNSRVKQGDTGKIMLYINTDGFKNNAHIVEYYIISNAKNSPSTLRIDVEDMLKDTTK